MQEKSAHKKQNHARFCYNCVGARKEKYGVFLNTPKIIVIIIKKIYIMLFIFLASSLFLNIFLIINVIKINGTSTKIIGLYLNA